MKILRRPISSKKFQKIAQETDSEKLQREVEILNEIRRWKTGSNENTESYSKRFEANVSKYIHQNIQVIIGPSEMIDTITTEFKSYFWNFQCHHVQIIENVNADNNTQNWKILDIRAQGSNDMIKILESDDTPPYQN